MLPWLQKSVLRLNIWSSYKTGKECPVLCGMNEYVCPVESLNSRKFHTDINIGVFLLLALRFSFLSVNISPLFSLTRFRLSSCFVALLLGCNLFSDRPFFAWVVYCLLLISSFCTVIMSHTLLFRMPILRTVGVISVVSWTRFKLESSCFAWLAAVSLSLISFCRFSLQ